MRRPTVLRPTRPALAALAVLAVLAACGGTPDVVDPPPFVPSLSLDAFFVDSIYLDETVRAVATVKGGEGSLTWTSSDTTVARVVTTRGVEAEIRGRAAGTTTLVARFVRTSDDKAIADTLVVRVLATRPPLAVTPDTLRLVSGLARTLTVREHARGKYLTTLLEGATWSSSAPDVAVVDLNGRVTPARPGTATITATASDRSAMATIVVTEFLPPLALADVTVGAQHTCALDANGAAWCWGSGKQGQLGASVATDRCGAFWAYGATGGYRCSAIPAPVAGGLRFATLEPRADHTCGLTTDGEAWCWGENGGGSLGGASTSTVVPAPQAVSGGVRFTSLSVGDDVACGIAADGTYCWGRRSYFNLIGDGQANSTDVVRTPSRVGTTATFASIDVGSTHACALTAGGEAYCWGRNMNGEAGVDPAGPNAVVCNPTASGLGCVSVPTPVATSLRFTQIAAGRLATCALDADGAVWCWGDNSMGQYGDGRGVTPPPGPPPVSITPVPGAMGARYTRLWSTNNGGFCGRDDGGAFWCWGRSELAVANVGVPKAVLPPVDPAPTFHSLSLDDGVACGIATDGLAYCWGNSEFDYGRLGTGDTSSVSPVARPVIGQR